METNDTRVVIRNVISTVIVILSVVAAMAALHGLNVRSNERAQAIDAEVKWENYQTAYLDAIGTRATALRDLGNSVDAGRDMANAVCDKTASFRPVSNLNSLTRASNYEDMLRPGPAGIPALQADTLSIRRDIARINKATASVAESHKKWMAENADRDCYSLGNSGTIEADHAIDVNFYCDSETNCQQSAVDNHPFAFISYRKQNLDIIAGANYGPGRAILGFGVGDVIRVNGTGGGLYRITDVMVVPLFTDAKDVPSGFAFQTSREYDTQLSYARRIA